MARVMMQFQRPGAPPTLDEIKAEYGLSDDEIDPTFGVVLIDPRDNTYAIRVDERAVAKLTPGSTLESTEEHGPDRHRAEIRGPYSNPRIEPTGLPRPIRSATDE